MPIIFASLLVLGSTFLFGGKHLTVPSLPDPNQISQIPIPTPCISPIPSPGILNPNQTIAGDKLQDRIDKDCASYNEPDKPEIPTDIKPSVIVPTNFPKPTIDPKLQSFHTLAPQPLPVDNQISPAGSGSQNTENVVVTPILGSKEPGSVGGQAPEGSSNGVENQNPPADLRNYQPLEIHGPNGIVTVSQSNL